MLQEEKNIQPIKAIRSMTRSLQSTKKLSFKGGTNKQITERQQANIATDKLKGGRLESSGQRLFSLNSKTNILFSERKKKLDLLKKKYFS